MNDAGRQACARCGADNRPGRRFCAQCGAALPVVCPACGFANEAGERFCGGCGGSLAIAPTPATQTGSEAAEAERRPVTVLFADLCGYTRLSQKQDPEDVHRMLERYFGAVDAIVERFGGRVDKHIGDAVMAIFGAPVAHGDDPARAVRAADAIVRAMPDRRRAVGNRARRAYRHRDGRGRRERDGQRPASRLYGDRAVGQSRGAPCRHRGSGRSRAGRHGSRRRSRARPRARCWKRIAIKGIDRPVTAWRLNALVAGGDAGAAPPFVGRAGELAQLAAVMQACATGGTGTVVHRARRARNR